MDILEKMGYKSELDQDGDIRIRYQMKNLYVYVIEDGETFLSVQLPQFYMIKDDEEALAVAACNKLTREMKMVKIYIEVNYTYVTAECHFFDTNEEALEMNLRHSLRILGSIRTRFREKLTEIREMVE